MTEPNQRSSLFSYFIFAGSYVLLFFYFLSFSRYGLNIWDEGGFANGSLRTLNGERAMEDFNPNGYPPGRYLFGVLLFKLFGVNVHSLRIGAALLTPAMPLMAYVIARKWTSRGFAALAALLVLSAPSMYFNRFFPFFLVCNLFFLTQFIARRSLFRLSLLTGSLLTSSFFKLEVALFSSTVCLVILSIHFWPGIRQKFFTTEAENRETIPSESPLSSKAIRTYIFVSACAAAAVATYFYKQDIVSKSIHMIWEMHQVWGNPFPALFPFFEELEKWGADEMFERIMFYLPLALYAWTIVWLAARFYKPSTNKTEMPDENLWVLTVLLYGLCAYGLVIWRAGFDNLLRTLPPFYILTAFFLYRAREKLIFHSNDVPVPRTKNLTVTAAVLFLPLLFVYEMNWNRGFYAGTIGAVRQQKTLLDLDRAHLYTNKREAEWLTRIVRIVQKSTKPGEAIFVLPINPIVYFLTDRPNPTSYDWILPGMLDDAGQRSVVEELKVRPPKMILYVDIAIDEQETRRFQNYAPIIYQFISERYRLHEFVGFFQILVPKL